MLLIWLLPGSCQFDDAEIFQEGFSLFQRLDESFVCCFPQMKKTNKQKESSEKGADLIF